MKLRREREIGSAESLDYLVLGAGRARLQLGRLLAQGET